MSRPVSPPNLPRSARDRLSRFEAATTHASLLTVPAAFGVRAAGFEAVGDVMGCIAFQNSIQYLGSCGVTRQTRYQPPVVLTPSAGGASSSYLRQLAGAYRTALERLRHEARVLGADGVIGVDLQLTRHEHLYEVVALGTAVRSTGRVRPPRAFTTDLPGADVAKLMLAGWLPVELHAAVRSGLRHGYGSVPGPSGLRSRVNVEVPAYTRLRQRVAQAVRDTLRSQVAQVGADGALLSTLRIELWERRCFVTEGDDVVAFGTALGTSITRFGASGVRAPAPLSVLPVGRGRR